MSTPSTATVPISRKVLIGFLTAVVAAVIQAVIPGYAPDPGVSALITAVIAYGSSFLVKEERKFLVPALDNADR